MKIGILECGTPPPDLLGRFGRYDAMMRHMLGEAGEYTTYDVTAGTFPAHVTDVDAYLITGSSAGVYDDLPWIPPLLRFLQAARHRAKLVGICFGHQAMAQAFGGHVTKSEKGWGLGLQRYTVQNPAPWMDAVPHVDLQALHQDQVVRCPPDARVLATSAFTEYAGLDYGDAISFQFHPEFGADYTAAVIETRRSRLGSVAEEALTRLNGPDDRARVAAWINRFLTAPAEQ
jgi:GMP synthase-like glutamine amidotransferase